MPVGKPAPPRPRSPDALTIVDDRVLAERHQLLGVVPVAARLRRLQARRLEAVEVGEDAVLVRERPGVAHPSRPPLARKNSTASTISASTPNLIMPGDEPEREEGEHDRDEDGDDGHLMRFGPSTSFIAP